MALFKVFNGDSGDLPSIPTHEGYAYFCTDDGSFHIDYMAEDGTLKRKQITVEAIIDKNGNEITVDDLVLATDVIDIAHGGTNANTAAAARTNLEIYSKTETDNKIDKKAVSVDYHITIPASGWVQNGDWYTYSYSNTALTCGKNGTTPPIISWESNLDEYSKIDHAEATADTGIIFYIEEAPENAIDIVIIDVK